MTKKSFLRKFVTVILVENLGELLLQNFTAKGWIEKENKSDKNFHITKEGEKAFTKLGIDLSQIKTETL